ncbi:hypothetical protein [Chryseobacterium sp. Hurlbut01]|uniref:hypothetical protein n=1 Tax=Chryseobacterium sp. Hurlbut01 TaxID=1681828 RepID=UPI00067D3CA1|nr:hypothetical protein [Chryseobacterium sp. Hurlbut01]KNB61002.1 hypothetical protein AC804_17825 [Chryseobacterium sp. Hurlbut01]
MSFPIDQQQIFAATNGGSDIITRFLPQAREKKHFKIREEGTESAWMSQKDGVFFVQDWGDVGGFYEKPKNAVHIYAHETGKAYFDALLALGEELGLVTAQAENEVFFFTVNRVREFRDLSPPCTPNHNRKIFVRL